MKRLLLVAATLSLVATSGAGLSALADPPTPDNPAGNSHEILGVVPAQNQAKPGGGGGSNLVYWGGPVMHTNKTYAIYWDPSGNAISSAYEATINSFFANVAADSAKTSNVYYSDTQYYDTLSGKVNISYSSSYSGSTVFLGAYPPSGCLDSVSFTNFCFTDAQLQTAVTDALAAQGLTPDPSTIYFLFTAPDVGSCFDSSATQCAFSYYCAYHSSFTTPSGALKYANQPYAAASSGCRSGQSPNGNDADATINVTSHEHNEAITDPLGSAWFDRRGAENGDKCAWNFGAIRGGSTTAGTAYNEVINGAHYYLQQEWSNAHSRCVLTGT